MDDEEDGVLSCAGMFWIDAAKKMALDCCPCDDDSLPRSERSEAVGDGTVLKREDMVVHGLCPARDEFFLVVCEQCQMLVKPQALAYHIDLRHRLGIGESHSAFLSSMPTNAAPTEKAIPRKRPTSVKPCESIGDAVIKSTICRRRRSRRAKVKSRSRIATQRQQFVGVDASNLVTTSCSSLPVDATPGNASSVFVPREFGSGGGLAVDLSNQRQFVQERLMTDIEPSAIVVEGLSEGSRLDSTDPKSSGRGIIIRFANLNRGKGPWIAEMGARSGRQEQREGGPVLLKDQSPSCNDDLKSLSFSGVQRTDYDASSSKGNEDLSRLGDYRSQLAEGHDLEDLATDTLKRRKPLPSVFKHRKICTEPLQDSGSTSPSFAHSSLYHVDKSIQFPLPSIGGSCFNVPALMPAVHFHDPYSSVETVVNGELGYEERVELRSGFGIGCDDIGRDFDANVQTCQDMSGHVNETVPMIVLQPSVPVPFCPQFASESWIEPGSDVGRVWSLESSRSWCHTIVAPLGSSSNAKESIGTSPRLEGDEFVGSGLAQPPSLSGSRGDSVCNDEGTTLVTAELFPSVDCRALFPPWTRCIGEATWNGATVSNVLGSVQECPLASSTVSVLPNDPAAQQLDVSSAMVEPIGHEITSTNADHCETLSFLGHCVSYDEDDPCFSSNHVHPDMLSHVVEPPSAATHFSSKFHLTATAPHPLSVGAQALTSAQVPCAQPWLCRIGANDS